MCCCCQLSTDNVRIVHVTSATCGFASGSLGICVFWDETIFKNWRIFPVLFTVEFLLRGLELISCTFLVINTSLYSCAVDIASLCAALCRKHTFNIIDELH